MTIWVVNDRLSQVRGTPTFWDDLIDTFGLVDKTGKEFEKLAAWVEHELDDADTERPDLVIRNASYFRPLKTNVTEVLL